MNFDTVRERLIEINANWLVTEIEESEFIISKIELEMSTRKWCRDCLRPVEVLILLTEAFSIPE
jgi:hypothetical protein